MGLRASDWVWWLALVIPTTPEADIGRIMVRGQPGQKVIKSSSQQISWT
jgi:hypothetical protein